LPYGDDQVDFDERHIKVKCHFELDDSSEEYTLAELKYVFYMSKDFCMFNFRFDNWDH
jgi:hypothetical protein